MFRGVTLVKWSHGGGQVVLKPGALWAGVVWAVSTTVFVCAALVLWVLMTSGTAYHLSGIISAGILLGAVIGGIMSGRAAGVMGLLHGAVAGVLYFMAIIAFLAAWNGGMPSIAMIAGRLLTIIVPAMLGGVIGVNISGSKHRGRVSV